MLAADRHHKILRLLQEAGAGRTKEVASELQVTDETIRKDFEVLEKKGLLSRSHGGAVPPSKLAIGDLTMNERQLVNKEAKTAIARAAAKRILPNETVFIDASSTALTMTPYLPDFPFTVITNSHDVMGALGSVDYIDLICTGGLFEPRSRSLIGLAAERTLRRYNIHRMFFSGSGVDLERGISERNSRQAAFKERVIEVAEDVCMLADDSKIGQKSAFFYADCKDLSTLITTKKADSDVVKVLAQLQVEVVTV